MYTVLHYQIDTQPRLTSREFSAKCPGTDYSNGYGSFMTVITT